MKTLLLGTLLFLACSSDSDTSAPVGTPGSCEPAVSHYYAAGCSYSSGTAISESTAVAICEGSISNFAPQCRQLSVSFIECNTRGGCGCQSDFDALRASCP